MLNVTDGQTDRRHHDAKNRSLLRAVRTAKTSDVSPWSFKAKFCGLGLAIGWPWPWDCDLCLGLRGLALAKNSRPKSWPTTMFTMNFHRLERIIFQDPRSLLTYRGHPWPFVTVQYQLHSQPGWPWPRPWPWPWDCGLGLDSVWPWP